ncbi:Ubiquitin-associated and SH3 domain-containing protein B [Paragonimus heterotremus]|uniref:Ubiquitin-associated and SH3 domain-containing protein B n=1 Tax=Paragonimus heterotremus TaxID=100268 RepID=A0A8J4T3A9_9TREM|nr:Ubiquitin-associated and SH3 domain-containing protein B [Paragonimus heterotremus]
MLGGWNTTFDFPPHIPVLHFEACCTSVPEIHRILETASCSIQNWFAGCKLSLKFVATAEPSFVGYELSDATGKTTLENLAKTLSVAIMQANVNVHLLSDQAKNHGPSHHLTLAQGFCPDLLPALTELHDQCLGRLASDPPSPTGWSVRLYSRDPRLRVPDPEVYEMLNTVEHDGCAESSSTWNPACNSLSATHHSNGTSSNVTGSCVESHSRTCYHDCCIPVEGLVVSNGPDRPLLGSVESTSPKLSQVDTKLTLLTHQHGDHVLLLSSCTLPGRQGCPLGLNLSTGSTGVFNLRAGRRIPQYHAWTLHGSIPIDPNCILLVRYRSRTNSQPNSLPANPDLSCVTGGGGAVSPSRRCRQPSQQSTASSPTVRSAFKDAGASYAANSARPNDRHFSSPSGTAVGSSNSSTSVASSTDATPSAFLSLDPVGCTNAPGASSAWILPTQSVLNSYSGNILSYARTPSSLSDRSSADSSLTGQPSELPQLVCAGAHGDSIGDGSRARFSHLRGTQPSKSRRIFVMRHAERVDACFGRGWVTRCFDKKGVYRRFNLNLPPWVPPRADYMDYALDAPISQVGLFVAAETGRGLAEAGVYFTACYSSPALRCVQTACELLRAMGQINTRIRVEPHLFEWLGWYNNCAPRMIPLQELNACGYPVDVGYQPLTSLSDVDPMESSTDFYARSATLTKRLLASHTARDTCILVVAHASSLDACTHRLVSHGFRTCISDAEFHRRTSIVPYCAFVVAEEHRRWMLVDPPIPVACSYGANTDFDWKQLLGTTLCGFRIR